MFSMWNLPLTHLLNTEKVCISEHGTVELIYFFVEDKDLFILHGQYHGCWCPGDGRSQGISSYGIHLLKNCKTSTNTNIITKKYGIKAKYHGWDVLPNECTTRSLVGALAPQTECCIRWAKCHTHVISLYNTQGFIQDVITHPCHNFNVRQFE